MLKFCKTKQLYAEQGENIDESVFFVKSRRFTTFFRSFVYLQRKRTCGGGGKVDVAGMEKVPP